MQAQRVQGLAFCAVAVAVALFSPLLPEVHSTQALGTIAVLILLLGVPHGALDPIFAQRLHHIRRAREWLMFGLLYVLAATLVVAAWYVAPGAFLIGFLLVSVAHFSGDLTPPTPPVTRLLYGGAIIVLPAALHSGELLRLFAILVGADSAGMLTAMLQLLAWPWLGALLIAATAHARRDWLSALEIVAVSTLALIAAPLYAFAVFFCAMHAARHILRTADYAGRRTGRRHLLMLALPPMVLTTAATIAIALRIPSSSLDTGLVQIIFIGLAALTVPHMALVERVRWRGWRTA
jgi:Brp/Blh family beta-carotene 15,15'-monooxygenase